MTRVATEVVKTVCVALTSLTTVDVDVQVTSTVEPPTTLVSVTGHSSVRVV